MWCGGAPDGSALYVVNEGNGTVSMIDTGSGSLVAAVPVAAFIDLVVTPDGSRLYVPDGNVTVEVVDIATRTVVDTVSIAAGAMFAAITPDGTTLYVTHPDSGSNNVSVVDTATASVTTTIPVQPGPTGVAVAPDSAHVYVAHYVTGTVSVIATATNTLVTEALVDDFPLMVAVGTRAVFVTHQSPAALSVIDV